MSAIDDFYAAAYAIYIPAYQTPGLDGNYEWTQEINPPPDPIPANFLPNLSSKMALHYVPAAGEYSYDNGDGISYTSPATPAYIWADYDGRRYTFDTSGNYVSSYANNDTFLSFAMPFIEFAMILYSAGALSSIAMGASATVDAAAAPLVQAGEDSLVQCTANALADNASIAVAQQSTFTLNNLAEQVAYAITGDPIAIDPAITQAVGRVAVSTAMNGGDVTKAVTGYLTSLGTGSFGAFAGSALGVAGVGAAIGAAAQAAVTGGNIGEAVALSIAPGMLQISADQIAADAQVTADAAAQAQAAADAGIAAQQAADAQATAAQAAADAGIAAQQAADEAATQAAQQAADTAAAQAAADASAQAAADHADAAQAAQDAANQAAAAQAAQDAQALQVAQQAAADAQAAAQAAADAQAATIAQNNASAYDATNSPSNGATPMDTTAPADLTNYITDYPAPVVDTSGNITALPDGSTQIDTSSGTAVLAPDGSISQTQADSQTQYNTMPDGSTNVYDGNGQLIGTIPPDTAAPAPVTSNNSVSSVAGIVTQITSAAAGALSIAKAFGLVGSPAITSGSAIRTIGGAVITPNKNGTITTTINGKSTTALMPVGHPYVFADGTTILNNGDGTISAINQNGTTTTGPIGSASMGSTQMMMFAGIGLALMLMASKG